jgi:hypothetical protein
MFRCIIYLTCTHVLFFGNGLSSSLVEFSLCVYWLLMFCQRVKVMLPPAVNRPVCQSPSWGLEPDFFFTVRLFPVFWCGALSLTRERVYRLQLLLVLARAVIFGSESRRTPDHILLPLIRDYPNLEDQVRIYIPQEQNSPVIHPDTGFPFRRLLRVSRLRWRYSNPPPRGIESFVLLVPLFKESGWECAAIWCRILTVLRIWNSMY